MTDTTTTTHSDGMSATAIGTRIGQAIARDVLAEDMPRGWNGIDA